MDQIFGNAYRGDPGVPHSGAAPFTNIWIGCFAFNVYTWNFPYLWQLTNQWNWHDKAFLYEQYHWKKARAKGQPYQFKWNQYMSKEARDAYYYNWPVYFP